MPYQSIDLPAGVYRHGTDLEGAGRWRDVNLVRWRNGALSPIGGWEERVKDGTTETSTATDQQTVFSYTFSPDRVTQIAVYQNDNLLASSAYVINLSAKTVTLNTGAALNDNIKIKLIFLDKPVRGAIAWVDNLATTNMAVGTFEKLFYISANNAVSDITPVGFTSGNEDAALRSGFGAGNYNTGYYGTERVSTGEFQEATTWSLDTWGEYLVGCSVDDGKLYEWQLSAATPADEIANAPTSNLGLVVTNERFLFALGAGGNPRKVQWCDKEDNTLWTPAATNEAGDFELATNGEILSGHKMRGRTLILTTTDAHIATYIGPQLVFQFQRAGTDCGAISRHACVSHMEGAYWMGSKSFFFFNGSAVQEMPCEVLDYVFTDLNTDQRSKVTAMNNTQYGEVWWFYPSGSSVENDRYVVYNYQERYWNIGTLSRTSGFDAGVMKHPIMFDANGDFYDHETGFDHDGTAPHAESGPILFGSNIVKVNEIIPDEKTQGQTTLTFKSRFYPNGSEFTHGPFTSNNPISARFSGRQIRMRVNGTELTNWRFGVPRLNVIVGGNR